MHRVFVTRGLVLRKRGVGESNTLVSILTEELGLVCASARSARKEVSKLRFGLESLTLARYSLVRGRHEWKLIGVEGISHALTQASSVRRGQIGRVTRLLLRLINGEEPVGELYDTVIEGLGYLSEVEDLVDAEAVECVLVLRIMEHLGYLPFSPTLAPFLLRTSENGFISEAVVAQVKVERLTIIRAINESINATGL